jgi:hypothetical protein
MKIDIGVFFENLFRKLKFDYYLKKMTGTADEDVCTCMISRRVLLRKRNVSGNIFRENQNTFFV